MIYLLAAGLAVLVGWSITGMARGTANRLERLGLSVLFGWGAVTVLLFIVGLVRLPIAPGIYLSILSLWALDGVRRLVREARSRPIVLRADRRWGARHPVIGPLTLLCLVGLLAIAIVRSLYLPNALFDSIAGFDLLGKVIAAEKVFRVSLFEYTSIARRGSYPPFTSLTLAWGYQTGLPSGMSAMALPLIGFFLWAYGFSRRFMGPTSVLWLLLLTLLSPDFYSWCHQPITNFPVAMYVAPAMLYTFAALCPPANQNRANPAGKISLAPAVIASGLAVWCRTDAIVFSIGAAIALLIYGRRAGLPLRWFLMLLIPGCVLLLWQVYSARVLGESGASRMIDHLFWDGSRVHLLLAHGVSFLTNVHSFGFAFILFVLGLLSHLLVRRGNIGPLVVSLLVALGLYLFLFYQTDPWKQDPLPDLMRSSFRRGIIALTFPFWFVWFLSPLGEWVRRCFGRLLAAGPSRLPPRDGTAEGSSRVAPP